ncbi:hypothetical protein, partial [Kingella denitrificans]|uniref:hypothetical protein n=1 Tax=Kingella denitrificans TaxID=502 RepID=UPI00164A5A54
TVAALDAYQPWLNAARTLDRLPDALDRICRLILCDSVFSGLLDDPKVGRLLDLPPAGPEGLGNICERCIGLDLPFGGLPEAQIMHE